MRVAVLHNRYRQPGGEDSVVEQEVELLRDRGHEVRVYLADNRSIEAGDLGVAARTIWSGRSRAAVAKFLDAAPVDIVHVHNTFPLLSPSVYASANHRGIPVVQTLHNFRLLCPAATFFRSGRVCTDCLGPPVPLPAVIHGCYRDSRAATAVVAAMLSTHRAIRTWSRRVDAFIALTGFAREKFIAGGLPEDRLHTRPNFTPDPGRPSDAGRRYDGTALYVGRLSEEKGVRVLVEAWQRVDVPISLIGDGPLRSELEHAAPCGVTFRGQLSRDEVRCALSRASFVLVPSICLETFGMAVIEAFSHGVPVIASDLGSLGDLVRDGVNGRLFPPGNADALAEAATALAADPDLRAKLGAAARRDYLSRFTPSAAYESLLEIYERAAATRRRRLSG